MSFWRYMFSWYSGNVWGNLIASLIWVIPGYLWGRYHVKKLHAHLHEVHKTVKKQSQP